jgi:hypothetical protein
MAVYLKTHASAGKSKPQTRGAAELVSASGMVLVRGAGRSEWQEVRTGAVFSEGDLIQTEHSGGAVIRYFSGTTVSIPEQTIFTVRNTRGNLIEITLPPQIERAENSVPPGFSEEPGSQSFLQLQRIVAFGRSLELVGHVEPGTNLTVNDDIVEVAGDGTFRHFTAPFPASVHKVRLVLRGVDLAGRIHMLTAIYTFSTGRGE